jgi:hypothetical protein
MIDKTRKLWEKCLKLLMSTAGLLFLYLLW